MSEPDEAAWEAAAQRHDEALDCLNEDPIQAEAIAAEARKQLEEVVGADHPDTLNARATVGLAQLLQGRVGEALRELEASATGLDMWRHEPEVLPARVRARLLLGDALRQNGQYVKAVEVLQDATMDAEASLAPDDDLISNVWNALGMARRFAGDYDDAADAYARSGDWLDQYRPADDPDRAAHHHNLSGLAHARGDYARSLEQAQIARAMRERLLGGAVDGALGQDLAAEAAALEGLGRVDEALERYERALEIYRQTFAPDHPEVAYALHNQADALAAAGRHHEAIDCYKESLALKEKLFGATHAEVAATLGNLAAALAEAGYSAEARKSVQRARAIAAKALPEGHPWRTSLESLAKSLSGAPS